MTAYLSRRLALMVPTLLLVSVMVFFIMRLIPGDVVSLMFGDLGYASSLEAMRTRLGLDQPLVRQYVSWMADIVRGHFGESLWTQRTVLSLIAERLPVTVELSVMALVFAIVYGVSSGLVAAVWQDRWPDVMLRGVAMAFLSLPTFWLGTLLIVLPSLYLGWSPSLELVPLTTAPLAHLVQFAVPAVILGTHLGAPLMRMSRAMMLEVLRQDYVRTAWAKGLGERGVIIKHAFRNAVIPAVTILGVQMSQAIAGSVVMETLFQLPGMGSLLVEAVAHRDFPVFQSLVLFLALFVMVVNLLVDLACLAIDPRLRRQVG